ncbi:MAG: SOS response-associated peptidase [Gemmatimonadota bacterium]
MCGRFGLGNPERLDPAIFGIPAFPTVAPRFNIAPTTPVIAVRVNKSGRLADLVRWGLIPHWAKDASPGNRLANVRVEKALARGGFHESMRRRRCLIPLDLFYEWQVVPGQKQKQPWAIAPQGGLPMALGGIWDYWLPESGRPAGGGVVSAAVLTTEPNSLLQPIHDRMPVLLTADSFGAWLDPTTPEARLTDLARPLPSELLRAWRVSTRVNRSEEEGAGLVEAE